jgi:uncharacterized membrane protein
MSDDNRAQFQIIVFMMIMFCLLALRFIAHVAGTPATIAAAVGASAFWRFVRHKKEVGA